MGATRANDFLCQVDEYGQASGPGPITPARRSVWTRLNAMPVPTEASDFGPLLTLISDPEAVGDHSC